MVCVGREILKKNRQLYIKTFKIRPTRGVVAHPDHERVTLFIESYRLARRRLDLNTLDPTGFSGIGRKCEQQEGKRQQELARDMSQRASLDEAWKRYASGVFHNWSKEARGQQASEVCAPTV